MESLRGGYELYNPKLLRDEEALQLFMKHAFRTNQFSAEYGDLSKRAIKYAQGLPLALKVLRAWLDRKGVREWEDVLEKIRETPHKGIQGVLRTSFDALDRFEKDIFLDIACIFKNWEKDFVTELLASFGFFPHDGLRVLVDRALITKSDYDNVLDMQDLLQEMGREIVPLEAIKLEKLILKGCSSLQEVHPSIYDLQNLVVLDLSSCNELKILPSSIHMRSLQFLNLSDSSIEKLPEIPEVMEKLTELHLAGTAIRELPLSIYNLTGLVHMNLEDYTKLKGLPSGIDMKSLRSLTLSGCSNLEKFSEFLEVMEKLTDLDLKGTAVKELTPSINNHTALVTLNLECCTELRILPSSIHFKYLWFLNLGGCTTLEKVPEISGIMNNLPELCLNETAVKELPSSIDLLQGLKLLSMRNCRSLVCLPNNICNLASLTHLYLSGCSKLSSLPDNFGSLESLEELEVQDSGIEQLPLTMLCLKGLKISLSRDGSKVMKAPFSAWSSSVNRHIQHSYMDYVRQLDLSDCNLLELSDDITQLFSLESIKLCKNNFERLPATMNRLGRLKFLKLEGCKRLKSIPELSSSVNHIDAHDCVALETVSRPNPPYQESLCYTFTNCIKLVQTNMFRDIVESLIQANCLRPLRLKMSLPGSTLPDWFNHKSTGFSASVKLQPDWCNSRLMGFAICAIRTCEGVSFYRPPISAACLCTFKGIHGECSFSFDLLKSVFQSDRIIDSDHMIMGYVSWSKCHSFEEGKLINETYTEATFEIVVVFDRREEQLRITSCGVRFIYPDQDDVQNQSMIHPGDRVDSRGASVSFDPSDMRDIETGTVEIIEILREVEASGSGSGEGRDYLTAQLFPEQQRERTREKDITEVTETLVCCFLSLSACTMCLRARETDRNRGRQNYQSFWRWGLITFQQPEWSSGT